MNAVPRTLGIVAVMAVALFAAAAPVQAEPPKLARSTHIAARLQIGHATYYATRFDGRRTASGTTFRNAALVAAHPTLPFGTLTRVTSIITGQSVTVKIVDRGPATGPRSRGVIIDLSQAAAKHLTMLTRGRAPVALQVLRPNDQVRAQVDRPPSSRTRLVLRMDTLLASPMLSDLVHASCDDEGCDASQQRSQPQAAHAAARP